MCKRSVVGVAIGIKMGVATSLLIMSKGSVGEGGFGVGRVGLSTAQARFRGQTGGARLAVILAIHVHQRLPSKGGSASAPSDA